MTTYSESGVNINNGNKLVKNITEIVKSTQSSACLGSFGGFGSLFKLPSGYKSPVLVSGTDGVGTKLRLATNAGNYSTIGQDLVAMCYNDIICQGATPLFFLDYFATSTLNTEVAEEIIYSIATACKWNDVSFVGGETAEMPQVFQQNEFDIAGFCVGIVEEDKIIDGSKISDGDCLVALPSSGPHSNGYSLINKIIEDMFWKNLDQVYGNHGVIKDLLQPTLIYSRVLQFIKDYDIHGIAHITGGGIIENLGRIIPNNLTANIHKWKNKLPIWEWIQEHGRISEEEMYRVFNCGVGMVLCLSEKEKNYILSKNPSFWELGQIVNSDHDVKVKFVK